MPAKPLDLFTAKPLMVSGRYTLPAVGTIRLRGKRAGKPFEREIRVNLPAQEEENQSLAQLWARTRIDDLMSQDWTGMQSGNPRKELREQITQLGLDYRLMTQFTSFVAVEEQTVVEGGVTRTVQVPVEMPHNVSPEGVFGERADQSMTMANSRSMQLSVQKMAASPGYTGGVAGGVLSAANPSPRSAKRDASPASVEPKSKDEKERTAREQDKLRRSTLESKLHPALLAAYDCWQKSGGKGNCAGVKNGKVQIQVWTENRTPQLQQELQARGFVASTKNGTAVAASALELTGEVDIDKLPLLAEVAGVKLIALQK
jgi:hypothetical protein